jgi:hypothetical protein
MSGAIGRARIWSLASMAYVPRPAAQRPGRKRDAVAAS